MKKNSKFYRKIVNFIEEIKDNIRFGKIGRNTKIIQPMRVLGKSRIFLGNNITILNGARLETVRKWGGVFHRGKLVIGDGTSIEQCCHIIAAEEVRIGKNVVISSFVYISDCSHGYSPREKIMESSIHTCRTVIGNHCFLGVKSTVLPGVTIGNNVIVGANAVVTHDVPDNSMVVGAPAYIIMKWSVDDEKWVKA